jgi:hypothetical protein
MSPNDESFRRRPNKVEGITSHQRESGTIVGFQDFGVARAYDLRPIGLISVRLRNPAHSYREAAGPGAQFPPGAELRSRVNYAATVLIAQSMIPELKALPPDRRRTFVHMVDEANRRLHREGEAVEFDSNFK